MNLFLLFSLKHRKNLRAFAQSKQLSIFYKNRKTYKIEGVYRKYPVEIGPFFPETSSRKTQAWTHIQLRMTNPNQKFIWLAKGMKELEWPLSFKQEKAVGVKHELPTEIEILASDLFFSGILLSDQVKASAQHVFSLSDQMLIYLKGETLGVLLPQGPEWQERWKITADALQLLVEIKDGLN